MANKLQRERERERESRLTCYKSSFVKGHIKRYALFFWEGLSSQIFRRRFIPGCRFREIAAILSVFILLSLCLLEPFAFAAEKDSPAPVPQQPAQLGNPSVSAITQAAVQAGALACTSRINQVTNFLTAGSQWFGAFLIVPQANPDQQIVSVSLEIQSKDAPLAYASASFAPNQANGCGGMYETVVYWGQGCDKVASQNFGGLKRIDTKQGAPSAHAPSIAILDGGATTKIFLMPAGAGCVSIKKEVVQ